MADVKSDRRQALDLALASIDRQFGKGAIMRLGQNGALDEISVIPTGALALDAALGIGGIPRGRVTEIYGPESSGKTTLALHVIAEAQRMGGTAAFIDAEHALDPIYAKNLGVNTDELLISQPDTGEQALEIAETLVRSNAVDVIVIDSVAALVPRAELDGDMGDSLPGLQARLMSQALRKLTAAISRSGGSVIFINQIREKIGVMFGSPETTTGGRALKFYASIRLDIRRQDTIKSGTEAIGVHTKVKVVKNKLAPPFREAEFDVIYGEGISKEGSVLDAAAEHNVVEKSGTWYTHKTERIGQGRENAKRYLKENPKLLIEIEAKVRAAMGLKPSGPTVLPVAPRTGRLVRAGTRRRRDLLERYRLRYRKTVLAGLMAARLAPPDRGGASRFFQAPRERPMTTIRFDDLRQYSDVLRARNGEVVTVRFVEPRDAGGAAELFPLADHALPLQPLPRRGQRIAAVAAGGFHPYRRGGSLQRDRDRADRRPRDHRRRSALCLRQRHGQHRIRAVDRRPLAGPRHRQGAVEEPRMPGGVIRCHAPVRRHAALQ